MVVLLINKQVRLQNLYVTYIIKKKKKKKLFKKHIFNLSTKMQFYSNFYLTINKYIAVK